MMTDTESMAAADRVSAAQAARSQRDLDPALTLPPAASGIAAALASDGETLAPLFQPEEARSFRDTWDTVQIGFVDDPKGAVRNADELVAQVMKTLAESFSGERSKLESQAQTEQASTENLRVALRRYRSFFQRLLAL